MKSKCNMCIGRGLISDEYANELKCPICNGCGEIIDTDDLDQKLCNECLMDYAQMLHEPIFPIVD